VNPSTWIISKLYLCLGQAQDLYHYIVPWRTNPFQSFDLATQALKIHISQSTILLPYLSYHSILINPKCKTNLFQLLVLLFMFGLYSVFICVQYFLFRLQRGAELQEWLLWVCWSFPRQVTHMSLYPFYLCISIFTSCSMHDRWIDQLFYQMLRS
jgi:hypothetical protein